MTDWLAIWGVTQAIGFVFKPILEEFAKNVAKDFTEDFFKDILKGIFNPSHKKVLTVAAGKALKEFLQLAQQELDDADLDDSQIKRYVKPFRNFVKDKQVAETLGSAFKEDCQHIDTKTLAKRWQELNSISLPDNFNWIMLTKRYQKKARAIKQESKSLREIFEFNIQESISKNLEETVRISPKFDLLKYRASIQEKYGNLRLDSLDTSGYAYDEVKLWRMFIPQNVREVERILPDLYELPKEQQLQLSKGGKGKQERLSKARERERERDKYYQQRPNWIFEIWNDRKNSSRVVILGDPGSGKSTLLQYVALEWTELSLKDMPISPIPLLVELRTYIRNRESGKCKDFLDFFHQGGGIVCRLNQHELHQHLEAGNVVMMLDGLDEIFEKAKRDEVLADIHELSNSYEKITIIVTSRIVGYEPRSLKDAGFRHFILQDLDQYQIDDFIQRWHELTFNIESEKILKRDRLEAAIRTSTAIRELAGNPLLLTMMAILNRNQELPRDRPELYTQASRVLLHQWDVERALIEDERLDPKTIDFKDKQMMLRQVAYRMQTKKKGLNANLISYDQLEGILSACLSDIEIPFSRSVSKIMINQLRTRNFILCFLGGDQYAFVHRTFLEFFCAWEFVWKFKESQVLSIEELKNNVYGETFYDDSWQEILRLIAGMIEPKFSGEIIGYLVKAKDPQKKYSNIFLAAKIALEARSLSSVSESVNELIEELKKITQDVKVPENVRIESMSFISRLWKNEPEILSFFKNVARERSHSLSEKAVLELARNCKENTKAFAYLKDLAKDGHETAISQIALSIKNTKTKKNDRTESLRILQTLARKNNQAAMLELARVGIHDKDSLTVLHKVLKSTSSSVTVSKIIKELAPCARESSVIKEILKEYAFSGNAEAIKGLGSIGKEDLESLGIIQQLSLKGHKAAIEELAWVWEEDPKTISILRELSDSGNQSASIELFLLGFNDVKRSLQLELSNNKTKFERVTDQILNDEILHLIYEDEAESTINTDTQKINRQAKLRNIKRRKRGIELGHFSTLRTKITSSAYLIAALRSLNITVKTDAIARGSNGQNVSCDVVSVLEGDFDIGWSQNADGGFDLIADLWGVARNHNQTELINSINQRYRSFSLGYKRFLR